MEDKKYEFTGETKVELGITFNRIKALRNFGSVTAGEIGGWVESEKNLSHAGSCWVYDDAQISGNARISGNAHIWGNARISGNARIWGDAQISKPHHVLNVIGLNYDLTLTPQLVFGGCRSFTHDEFKNLTIDNCQSSWLPDELENYKSLLDIFQRQMKIYGE